MKFYSRWAAGALYIAALSASSFSHAATISGQGTWETTLQGRDLDGNLSTIEAYYDTALNITWLANANAGAGSIYDDAITGGTTTTDGRMSWANANAWVASFNSYGNGITGWRLPTTIDVGGNGCTYTNWYQGTDCGYNITTLSEMSHMFYVTLGNKAIYSTTGAYQPAEGLTNSGPFSNIQVDTVYWSATEYVPHNEAWMFGFNSGDQETEFKTLDFYAWAVHSGDIGVSTVPVPPAIWLFGSGLVGFLGMSRKHRR